MYTTNTISGPEILLTQYQDQKYNVCTTNTISGPEI